MNEELKNKYKELENEINHDYHENIHNLKACPFCGDTPTLDICQSTDEDDWSFWYVSIRCHNCGCTMKDFTHIYENSIESKLHSDYLVEKWNMRIKLKDE